MNKTKFWKVALPSIVAFLMTYIVIIVVRPGAISWNWNKVETKEEEEFSEEYIDNTNDINKQYFALDYQNLIDLFSTISEERAPLITELKITNINNEQFEEQLYDSDKEPSEDQKITMDLSCLSYFPNLEKLTLLPVELSQDHYTEADEYSDTTNYYYTLDEKSLTAMPKLKELYVEFAQVEDLSLLEKSTIEEITFKNCNFKKLKKSEYEKFAKFTSIGLEEGNKELNVNMMLSNAKNVKTLNLNGIEIKEAQLLERLPEPDKLEGLSFQVNTKDKSLYEGLLEPVSNLKSLSIAYVTDAMNVKDAFYEFNFLGKMKQLEHLWLQGNKNYNQYTDYIAEAVYYDGNDHVYKTMDDSIYDLDLSKNNYHDYGYLSQLKNLKSLTMDSMEVTDLSFLAGLTKLETLSLPYNFVRDLSPMQGLINLEQLDLSFNFIQDLSPLSGLTKVTKLSIGNNKISSIEAVRNMSKLETFDASSGFYYKDNPACSATSVVTEYYSPSNSSDTDYYHIDSGYNPKGMEDLEEYDSYMYQDENSIGWFDFELSNVTLDVASASNYVTFHPYNEYTIWGGNKNLIEDVSPLEQAEDLVFLDLSGNQIRDISSLRNLGKLQFLSCMDNHIEDISILSSKKFPELGNLYLSQNNFTDGSVLRYLGENIPNLLLQYYMTPFYNKTMFQIIEPKEPSIHINIMDFDISELFANVGSGMEK